MKIKRLLIACCVMFVAGSGALDAAQSGLIRDENQKPGALDWQLTRVRTR